MLPLVIVNPASQGGRGGKNWPHAASALCSHFGPFDCVFTERAGHATEIAEHAARNGRDLLLVFGGDGSISDAINGLMRVKGKTQLAALPNGTGSDFVRSLNLPKRFADLAAGLRDGVTRRIDVGHVQFPEGGRWFLNSASFGLSGEVAFDANTSSKMLGGKITFAASAIRQAFGYEAPLIHLDWKSAGGTTETRQLQVTTVSLHNGGFFGGGMHMAPEAKLADGLLDVIIIRKVPLRRLVRYGHRLYFGTHQSLPDVEHRTLQSLRARCEQPQTKVRLEVDGESPGFLPAEFRVEPKALTLRLPRS